MYCSGEGGEVQQTEEMASMELLQAAKALEEITRQLAIRPGRQPRNQTYDETGVTMEELLSDSIFDGAQVRTNWRGTLSDHLLTN